MLKITDVVITVTEILLDGEYKQVKAYSESCYSPAPRGEYIAKAGYP